MRYSFIIGILALSVPFVARAQVVISEIFYDVEGADSTHEWVEVWNQGAAPVDLSSWRLFEADTNHKLTPVGSSSVPAGGFAVIADNASVFAGDVSGFNGVLFDSAFSLSNVGELLVLRDGALIDIDSVLYSADWGAKGDGNSLQWNGSTWIPAEPTPGASNTSAPAPPVEEAEDDSGDDEQPTNAPIGTVPPPRIPRFVVSAGADRRVVVGASSLFTARAVGEEGIALENERYTWTFGDGARKEGERVLHTYRYPGEYVAVVSVSSGKASARDRVIVSAEPADIVVTAAQPSADGFIELDNQSRYEIDLSFWYLQAGNETFELPHNTILLPGKRVRFANDITRLFHAGVPNTELLYPNGNRAAALASEARDVYTEAGGSVNTAQYVVPPVMTEPEQENTAPRVFSEDVSETVDEVSGQIAVLATGTAHMLAGAGTAGSGMVTWGVSLTALLGLSILGLFALRRVPQTNLSKEDGGNPAHRADDFTIIEE